jgi:hypothetical protein
MENSTRVGLFSFKCFANLVHKSNRTGTRLIPMTTFAAELPPRFQIAPAQSSSRCDSAYVKKTPFFSRPSTETRFAFGSGGVCDSK